MSKEEKPWGLCFAPELLPREELLPYLEQIKQLGRFVRGSFGDPNQLMENENGFPYFIEVDGDDSESRKARVDPFHPRSASGLSMKALSPAEGYKIFNEIFTAHLGQEGMTLKASLAEIISQIPIGCLKKTRGFEIARVYCPVELYRAATTPLKGNLALIRLYSR